MVALVEQVRAQAHLLEVHAAIGVVEVLVGGVVAEVLIPKTQVVVVLVRLPLVGKTTQPEVVVVLAVLIAESQVAHAQGIVLVHAIHLVLKTTKTELVLIV